MKSKSVAALTLGVALGACSSSALMVERAPTAYRASTARLEYVQPTIAVEEGTQRHLQQKMEQTLVSGPKSVFQPGNDLTIRYQFVGHSEGSRFGRWLTGGLAGGSKTYIQAEFINGAGQVIGGVRSEGSVGVGIAGGSAKSGVDGAVKKIANYASTTFKR